MDDRQLANAAAVYFGGRARAEHLLTCNRCHVDGERLVTCPSHPDRRREAARA